MSLDQGKDEAGGERKELRQGGRSPQGDSTRVELFTAAGVAPLRQRKWKALTPLTEWVASARVSDCLPFLAAHLPTGETHFSPAVPRFPEEGSL